VARLALASFVVGVCLCPPASSQERRLAPGDIVQLNVLGRPEMSGQFRVAPNGRVTIPGLGELEAAGLTREEFGAQLQQTITGGAAPSAEAQAPPAVAVGILATALHPLAPGDSISIAVEGEPELTRWYLVLDDGTINMAYVGQLPAAGLPLSDFVSDLADRLREFIVAPVVTVSDLRRAPRHVYISGAVGATGQYSLWDYPTLLSLLAGAGWLTPQADLSKAMLLRAGEKQLLQLDEILTPEAEDRTDIPLLADDHIIIPTADVPLIHVTGQVALSGAQPLREGDRVSAVVARAGGIAPTADPANAGVLRGGQWMGVDLEAVLGGDAPGADMALEQGDVVVVPEKKGQFYLVGAVVNPGAYTLQQAETVLEALSLAGGVRPDGAPYNAFLVRETVAVPLDLDKLMTEGDPALDLELADGDRLVVPDAKRTVFVWGQVGKPGSYPIRPGDTYMDIVSAAGGLAPQGKHKKILIVRQATAPGEQTHVQLRDLARMDPSDEQWRPQPGDLVWVPTREELAKERLLRWVGGIASGALMYGVFRR